MRWELRSDEWGGRKKAKAKHERIMMTEIRRQEGRNVGKGGGG